jgi:hypothetical protein
VKKVLTISLLIGNCLFRAFSDQIYGTQNKHHEVRARVISEMQEHPERYKPFITVHSEPIRQSRPRAAKANKRKIAGADPSSYSYSQVQVDASWDKYVSDMSKDGTWGSNIEIQAFAAAYDHNVKIWRADEAPYITVCPEVPGDKPLAHIAFHVCSRINVTAHNTDIAKRTGSTFPLFATLLVHMMACLKSMRTLSLLKRLSGSMRHLPPLSRSKIG